MASSLEFTRLYLGFFSSLRISWRFGKFSSGLLSKLSRLDPRPGWDLYPGCGNLSYGFLQDAGSRSLLAVQS
jgi:hypothetical protein